MSWDYGYKLKVCLTELQDRPKISLDAVLMVTKADAEIQTALSALLNAIHSKRNGLLLAGKLTKHHLEKKKPEYSRRFKRS